MFVFRISCVNEETFFLQFLTILNGINCDDLFIGGSTSKFSPKDLICPGC